MKKLLVIAYYFPPSGGPGVQRVLKYVKYLPENGWQPYILTVRNANFPVTDPSLIKEIPQGIIVERTAIFEPYDLYRSFTGKERSVPIDVNVINKDGTKRSSKERLSEFIRANFFIPDARIGWYPYAIKAGSRMIENYGIDAIYSSSPPYTCSLIAMNLSRRFKLPWIAGFRDPWSGFISTPVRKGLARRIDRSLERKVFRNANLVECAWEGIVKDAIRKFPDLDQGKFHVVPNGFDPSDFPEILPVKNTRFTITYSGSLYGRRNPGTILKSVESLIRENKLRQKDILIRFIGRFGDDVMKILDHSPVKPCIEVIPYLPHEESIKALVASDALLLIVDDAPESDEIIPGKVYEYMGSGRPIIGVAPGRSAVSALLKVTGSGYSIESGDIEGLSEILLKLIQSWKEGTELFHPVKDEIMKFERSEAARNLSKLLWQMPGNLVK